MLQQLFEFCKASSVIPFFPLKQLAHKVLTTFKVCSFEIDILPSLIAHHSFLITSKCYLQIGLCMCKSTWRTCPTHAQHMELCLGNFSRAFVSCTQGRMVFRFQWRVNASSWIIYSFRWSICLKTDSGSYVLISVLVKGLEHPREKRRQVDKGKHRSASIETSRGFISGLS